VAGMVRLAIAEREGRLDLPRMAHAARLPESAIEAALAWLAAMGKIALSAGEQGWVAAAPAPTEQPSGAPDEDGAQEALARLEYILGEVAAYRRAWPTLSLTELLR
ncbi:MAG: hypothetical protein ABFD20_12885, partial [Anaerolineales bacterium]